MTYETAIERYNKRRKFVFDFLRKDIEANDICKMPTENTGVELSFFDLEVNTSDKYYATEYDYDMTFYVDLKIKDILIFYIRFDVDIKNKMVKSTVHNQNRINHFDLDEDYESYNKLCSSLNHFRTKQFKNKLIKCAKEAIKIM